MLGNKRSEVSTKVSLGAKHEHRQNEITLTGDRRIRKIETDEFTLVLNGKENTDYKAILAPLGIDLQFVEDPAPSQPEVVKGKVNVADIPIIVDGKEEGTW